MPRSFTLPASRVLRAPFIETRNEGTRSAYRVLVDAPLWVEWVHVFQGFRRPDGLLIEVGNPYRGFGEECFQIIPEPESPHFGSALYRVDMESGRLSLAGANFDSSD